jgi:uncharacterized membrane protein YedE/YeeE
MSACRRCRSMSLVLAAAVGVLFGAGLLVSGMTQPARVVGFLDPIGGWDPTLAFVMAGAVAVYAVAFRMIRGRAEPWFDVRFHLPSRRDIDRELVVGAALFGIGWGLAGLCPGPAIVSAGGLRTGSLVFVVAMLTGMWLHKLTSRRRQSSAVDL